VALETARMIHRATDRFITNPRNIESNSLLDQDVEWVNNLSRYMQEFDHLKAKKKPKEPR
jgi:hypothetical protein